MENAPITPTLQSLINQKIKRKDLSRPELVSAIGYTNISKGNRRLNHFLNTLETPSSDFINNLLSVLDIDCITFNKSINVSLDQFSNQPKKKFKPYIQIILSIEIRPLFASQMVANKCSVPVVIDRLKRATHDRVNGATRKWLNQGFGVGYFLPFSDLEFKDLFCVLVKGFGTRKLLPSSTIL